MKKFNPLHSKFYLIFQFLLLFAVLIFGTAFQSSAQDVIGEWKFEGNGNAEVGNPAVETGSTSYTTGVSGQALSIDAQHGYATIEGALSSVGTDPFTISAWVNYDGDFVGHVRHESPLTTFDGSSFGVFIFSERPEVNLDRTYHTTNNQQIFFDQRAPWITNPNQWHHVVLGRDANNQYLCLNGELISSAPISSMSDHSQASLSTFYVGYIPFQNGGRSWPGMIDELYIYNDWIGHDGCATLFANPGESSLDPDSDGDGVDDANDLCANTPAGESVNADGCSCSQVTVDDGDPCTLDECVDGVVTNTFQDSDVDGVCDANDVCPGGDDNLDNDVDGTPDFCDDDDDNDGIEDECDSNPLVDNFTFTGIENLPAEWLCGNNNNKVKVCHVPPGNPANAHTICVSPNAVSAHIGNHDGDYLGECTCTGQSGMVAPPTNSHPALFEEIQMDVFPNPASNVVNFHMHGVDKEAVLNIVDQFGRQVWTQQLAEHQHVLELELGAKFQNGIYVASITSQGETIIKRFVVTK